MFQKCKQDRQTLIFTQTGINQIQATEIIPIRFLGLLSVQYAVYTHHEFPLSQYAPSVPGITPGGRLAVGNDPSRMPIPYFAIAFSHSRCMFISFPFSACVFPQKGWVTPLGSENFFCVQPGIRQSELSLGVLVLGSA